MIRFLLYGNKNRNINPYISIFIYLFFGARRECFSCVFCVRDDLDVDLMTH